MRQLIYLSHPEVLIDPDVPVPHWPLTDQGRERARSLAAAAVLANVARIVSSKEVKALQTAGILSELLEVPVTARADMGENDRSATGFLPGPEFEQVADAFFAAPDQSVRGWETAQEAQNRIVHAAEEEIARGGAGDLLLVGHGAVGTLLWCHLRGVPISRDHDQTLGGSLWIAPLADLRPLAPWAPIEIFLSATKP